MSWIRGLLPHVHLYCLKLFTCTLFLVLAGKGGWTAERKYELDSGAYFINLLHNYVHTPGLYDPERLLMEPVLHDAVLLMLKVRCGCWVHVLCCVQVFGFCCGHHLQGQCAVLLMLKMHCT
jgi:hypothetical protein